MAKLLQRVMSLLLIGLGVIAVFWVVLAGLAPTDGGSVTTEGTIDSGFVEPRVTEPLFTRSDGSTFSIGPTFAGPDGDVTVDRIAVTARFPDPNVAQMALVTVAGLIWLALIFGVVWQLRALLRAASAGEPFSDRAPRRVRVIGILILATAVAEIVQPWIRQAIINTQEIGVTVSAAGVAWGSVALSAGIGLTILVVAEAFDQGVRLREFEELVV